MREGEIVLFLTSRTQLSGSIDLFELKEEKKRDSFLYTLSLKTSNSPKSTRNL